MVLSLLIALCLFLTCFDWPVMACVLLAVCVVVYCMFCLLFCITLLFSCLLVCFVAFVSA